MCGPGLAWKPGLWLLKSLSCAKAQIDGLGLGLACHGYKSLCDCVTNIFCLPRSPFLHRVRLHSALAFYSPTLCSLCPQVPICGPKVVSSQTFLGAILGSLNRVSVYFVLTFFFFFFMHSVLWRTICKTFYLWVRYVLWLSGFHRWWYTQVSMGWLMKQLRNRNGELLSGWCSFREFTGSFCIVNYIQDYNST